ncbi:FH2 domain-containing protein [Plasmodiophora brassicae]|nr:unnamed protein product [Plasmodiophora brassicae]
MSRSSLLSWANNLLDSADESAAGVIEKAGVAVGRTGGDDADAPGTDRTSPTAPVSDQERSPTPFIPIGPVPSDILAAKDAEIQSLKSVWNQTRAELTKTKAILRQREDVYRSAMAKKQDELESQLEANESMAAQRVQELEAQLAAVQNDQAAKQAAVDEQVHALTERIETLSQSELELKAERDALVEASRLASEEHARRVQEMTADFERRHRDLRDQTQVSSGSLQHYREREAELTNEKVQYAASLAQAQLELQTRSAELKKAVEERNWADVQRKRLEEEIAALKRQVASANDAAMRLKAQCDEVSRRERDKVAELQASHDEAQRQLHAEISQLRSTLEQTTADSGSSTIQALERKCANLTKHLLQRQTELERTGSVASTLSLQLESERKRCSDLDAERRRLEARLADIASRVDIDVESGSGSGYVRKRRGRYTAAKSNVLGRVLDIMDNAGAGIGIALRRSPVTRIGLVVYVVLLHIWVLFVLNHYLHHEVSSLNDAGPHDIAS